MADANDGSMPGLIESGAIVARPLGQAVADIFRFVHPILLDRTQVVVGDAHLHTNVDAADFPSWVVVQPRPDPVNHLADLMSRGVAIHRPVPPTIQYVDDWLTVRTASPAFNAPVFELPLRIPRWLAAWAALPAFSAQGIVETPVRRPRIVWDGTQGGLSRTHADTSDGEEDIEIVD